MSDVERGSGPCPDDNLLAAWMEGRVSADERERTERHLAGCPACAELVGALIHNRRASQGVPRRLMGGAREWATVHWRGLAAAAALVILAGLYPVLRAGFGRIEVTPPESTDATLVAWARTLSEADPVLLGDFRPLAREERLTVTSDVLRGGLVALTPYGRTLDGHPSFSWEAQPGLSMCAMTVFEDGMPMWTAPCAGPRCAFPADKPELRGGALYLWQVACQGPVGTEESALRAFEVASPKDSASFLAARRLIGDRAPERVRNLLSAHLALRRGYTAAALAEARLAVEGAPKDPVARETLYHVLALLGSSEAEQLRPAGSEEGP